MSLTQLGTTTGRVESICQTAGYIRDPLIAYAELCKDSPYALLLESAEIDSKDNLKSLLLVDAALRIECQHQDVTCSPVTSNGTNIIDIIKANCPAQITCVSHDSGAITLSCPPSDPNSDEDTRLKSPSVFDALRAVINGIKAIRDVPHAVFLGGVFAYDLLATFEDLPTVDDSENTCPDYVFYVAETLLRIDHQAQTTDIVGSVFSGPNVADNYLRINQRVEAIQTAISQLPSALAPAPQAASDKRVRVDKSDGDYVKDVEFLKEHILAGDIFQVVPSRTFSIACPSAEHAYATLRQQNPSPYMFFLKDADFTMFGASPESALKYSAISNIVEIYPIAGTRPRGKRPDGSLNHDLDSRIELNLREDSKETSEHIMLVDLARNDVARVSKAGTRYVKDLLKVDRYSHVMHLVSRVVGELRDDLDALHAYQACMNMGTLVGAPKVSAASLIRETEKQRRGSYGGAVGYLNGQGDMDSCIVIRSAFVRNGVAYIQAGAGVVHDSIPQAEADETRGKAQAVITAILSSQQTHAGALS
ncbi:anthranilate synthase component 1 [Alteromonas oceanisediminis]|uniref:anthranilate synthase component 1 n=1 Tax=Alteromonas oceanisediminis TaxID=2836180 RepID=UPI001BDB231C|nr:anthranilate synthase component 1 [Alteromonas oceanisediminis]MBT0588060.1 anthranilate synthase component 1 [Alteromonas oceanisediminis]